MAGPYVIKYPCGQRALGATYLRDFRGVDLQSEHERYLTEQYAKKPVIVMNYPKAIKAFYMRVNDDGRTVAAMDVLAPGIGEIVGRSQHEERLEVLDAGIAEAASTAEPLRVVPRPAPLRHGLACRLWPRFERVGRTIFRTAARKPTCGVTC